jgi:hypothetical protein
MKVRLPGIPGTMSVNFLFILIGIADFTMAEALTISCAAILVQCLWRTRTQPWPLQVAFNLAALAISIAAAYLVSHLALTLACADSLSALLGIAACTFFLSNTLLVSGVLCLVAGQPLKKIWQHVWPLVVPVLPGRTRHCRSGYRFRPHYGLAISTPARAADVPYVQVLRRVFETGDSCVRAASLQLIANLSAAKIALAPTFAARYSRGQSQAPR